MKLDQSKSVIDDHEDNFAIVFSAMGVSQTPCSFKHHVTTVYSFTLSFLPLFTSQNTMLMNIIFVVKNLNFVLLATPTLYINT